jgi:hypothetical protein
MAQLRKMVYGDQGTTVNFINDIMNQVQYSESDQGRAVQMAGKPFQNAVARPTVLDE